MNNLRLFITNKLFNLIPETRGFGIKRGLLHWCGASIGSNVRICSSVKIVGCGELYIGDNTWIGHRTLLVVSDKIRIGKNVNIAPDVFIGNGTHSITPATDSIAGPGESLPIDIGNGSWICARASLIAGAVLGPMSIVAANSLYMAVSDKAGILWGGSPAKPLKYYELV